MLSTSVSLLDVLTLATGSHRLLTTREKGHGSNLLPPRRVRLSPLHVAEG